MLDVSVAAAALGWSGVRTSSVGAEAECRAEVTPFDGWVLARALFGLPIESVPAALAACQVVDVGDGLRRRGVLVVNRAGRVGVVISDHLVVQPAGRVYALATTTDGDWVSAFVPAALVETMRVAPWVRKRRDRPRRGPTQPAEPPVGQFNRAGWAGGAISWAGVSPVGAASLRAVSFGAVGWAGMTAGGTARWGPAGGAVLWVGVGTSTGTQFRGAATGGVGWVGFCSAGTARVGAGAGTFGWAGAATSDSGKLGSAGGGVSWAGAAVGVRPGGTGFGLGGFGTSPFGASGTTHLGSCTGGVRWAATGVGVKPVVLTSSFALTGGRLSATAVGGVFVLGTTKPVLVDPLNPVGTDNVGWTGDTSGGTFTTTHTVPSNTTRKGCVFLCDVILTDATSVLEDCIVFGGDPTPTRPSLVTAANGGQLTRTTIYGTHTSVVYYRNAVKLTGGTLTVTRCAIYRCTDALRFSGGRMLAYGCLMDRFSFWDNDQDQQGATIPYWSHNDAVQGTGGSGPHEFIGNLVWGRCDVTGVTWSGGSPGAGTASNGAVPPPVTTRPTVATPIGMPATQLNAGYRTQWLEAVYCNGLSFTSVSGFIVNCTDNWIEGTGDPSASVQFTTGTTNQITVLRNRFGIGGYRTLSTRKFLVAYDAGTTVKNIGTGGDVNVFGDFQSCVDAGVVGHTLTETSGGLRYSAPN